MSDAISYFLDASTPDARESALELVDRWSQSPALRTCIEACNLSWPEAATPVERLRQLERMTKTFDVRRGRERLEISRTRLDNEDAILGSAKELGMVEPHQPSQSKYDHLLILGGIAASCFLRTRHARELSAGQIEVPQIGSLGALRELGADELAGLKKLVSDWRSNPITEFDVLLDAGVKLFEPDVAPEVESSGDANPNLKTALSSFQSSDGIRFIVIAAMSSDPSRRANTFDNYQSYVDRFNVLAGDAVLVCTSQIYVPYQFFTALRFFGLDAQVRIEFTGFPPEWVTGEHALRAPQNYLQEVRSAIQAAILLAESLV
jgi:hypothetical protein